MDDRFKWLHPLPTEREREILVILIEEAAEVQHRATKLLRFGRDQVQPGQDLTNGQRLAKELGDMAVLVEMTAQASLIDLDEVKARAVRKREKLARYMATAEQS